MSAQKVRRYRRQDQFLAEVDYIEYADVAGLVEAMKKVMDDAEQAAFENWLSRTSPYGDCESVHSQWLDSADYDDLGDDWHAARNELARWQS